MIQFTEWALLLFYAFSVLEVVGGIGKKPPVLTPGVANFAIVLCGLVAAGWTYLYLHASDWTVRTVTLTLLFSVGWSVIRTVQRIGRERPVQTSYLAMPQILLSLIEIAGIAYVIVHN